MKALIIKMSSLGDIIHTLPALTDAAAAMPGIQFDWVVERPFAEIPSWHPAVKHVIPLAWRHWRKQLFNYQTYNEWRAFYKQLRLEHYDRIIDAQGLIKSAILTRLARGLHCGLNYRSAREPLASIFYQQRYPVLFQQHAVARARQLFAQALGYALPMYTPNYGIRLPAKPLTNDYLVFLHGTTWLTKHWPESYWRTLAEKAMETGIAVQLPWGNPSELARAQRIAKGLANVKILPRLSLAEIAVMLAGAKAVIAVDSGLGHLCAALEVPTVSLYGPTNPALTGTVGKNQIHLVSSFSCAPCLQKQCTYNDNHLVYPACFTTLPPQKIWDTLLPYLKNNNPI
jgi:heptosyltransferase-1